MIIMTPVPTSWDGTNMQQSTWPSLAHLGFLIRGRGIKKKCLGWKREILGSLILRTPKIWVWLVQTAPKMKNHNVFSSSMMVYACSKYGKVDPSIGPCIQPLSKCDSASVHNTHIITTCVVHQLPCSVDRCIVQTHSVCLGGDGHTQLICLVSVSAPYFVN